MTLRWLPALCLAALLVSFQAAAADPAPDTGVAYTVKRGDTLYDLAARYFVRRADAAYVQRLNGVARPQRLPIGLKLTIPAELLRSEPVVGRLLAYSGPVAVRGEGAGPLRRDMEIREGYQLSTGANAFLSFELPDGSRTSLPSQSSIRIERLRRVLMTGAVLRDFQLENGRSTSVVTPMTDPASRFRILTPLAVSAVRGTEFRVAHDEAAHRSTIEVIEGQVGETAGLAQAQVAAGFGAAASAAGLSAPQALLPRPELKNAAQLQDDPQVRFDLQGPAGAAGYRAQIANDAGFSDITTETVATEPRLVFDQVVNGTFFVRFTALGQDGLEGLPAIYAFERHLNALGLDTPAAVNGAKRQYLFKWRSTGGASETFRFVLARRIDGSEAVIDELGLTTPQIVVTDLPRGVYYWRVLVSRREDGRLFEKWSPPQQFEIGG